MKYDKLSGKDKLSVLRKRFNFNYLSTLELDEENRIKRNFIKSKEIVNVIYLIAIDDELVYIGKTNCFWKRLDTYRNSKYWKEANKSNVIKTESLETAIKENKKVDIYIRNCVSFDIKTEIGKVKLCTMHTEEPRFIREFKPIWNVQCKSMKI